MSKIIKKYDMGLYTLQRDKLISYTSKLSADTRIEKVNQSLFQQLKQKYPRSFKIKKYSDSKITICVALTNEQIVGYGSLKTKNCKDTFYRIGENVAYLSSFFVEPEQRGKGIYPAMISFLVENSEYEQYYISAYTSNIASLNGLQKTGFVLSKKVSFIRFLKTTLFKHYIRR